MRAIVGCPICGSEKLYGRKCQNCLDMNDEEWAIKDAIDAYVSDHISIEALEQQIELALTDPPHKVYWTSIIYR